MSYPKNINTYTYPVQANIETTGALSRVEPLLTPEKLKSRFLKGVLDKFPKIQFTDEELRDRITLAINELEIELKIPIFAERFSERIPFDYNLYKHFIHIRTNAGPILSVEDLSIVSSDGQNIFRVPSNWVEVGNAHQRQINVIPLLGAYGATSTQGAVAPGGIAYIMILQRQIHFMPAYWTIEFTAGLSKDIGRVPIVVNQLIGIYATIMILSELAPINSNNSISLSQDGIGQSSSGPGVQIFLTRIQELENKKRIILGQIRRILGQKIFVSNF